MKDSSLLQLEKLKGDLNSKIVLQITREKKNDIKSIQISKGNNFSNLLKTNYIYFISEGFVLQFCNDRTGNEKALDIYRPNDILGIETMYNSMTTLEKSLALTPVKLYAIPVKILEPYFCLYPSFLYNNLQHSIFVKKIDLLGTLLPGDQRILLTIIELLRSLGKTTNGTVYLPDFITHNIISLFASVSRSYVSKTISILITEGFLTQKGRFLACSDIDKLMNISIYFNNEYQ
ncbi:Crp/Fnr family transcriptional regulator [Carnobacterium sp.]|uniref:Crp/Fnr family transcriptional regulator n=1 Tax=Carnobacterium sp. TaxID=48221 RepID=UPI002FC8E0F4